MLGAWTGGSLKNNDANLMYVDMYISLTEKHLYRIFNIGGFSYHKAALCRVFTKTGFRYGIYDSLSGWDKCY